MRHLTAVLILLALLLPSYAQPLQGVTVVLDPGHGDRAVGEIPADPGACVRTPHGMVAECVFTWDTGMRLRRRLQALGAEVVLTLEDPSGAYDPEPWTATDFPESDEFRFKTLVENPKPRSIREALVSRVSTANRVYRERSGPTYFFSLHFDSTSPEVGGVKFYYPRRKGGGSGFIQRLEESVREADRARLDLTSGEEIGISGPGDYLILRRSLNPDSYLIEFGNILSRNAEGGNPDLWRMRDPVLREEYAAIIAQALVRHHQPAQVASPPSPAPRIQPQLAHAAPRDDAPFSLALATLGLLLLACALALRRCRRVVA